MDLKGGLPAGSTKELRPMFTGVTQREWDILVGASGRGGIGLNRLAPGRLFKGVEDPVLVVSSLASVCFLGPCKTSETPLREPSFTSGSFLNNK